MPARFHDDLPPVPVLIIDEDAHSEKIESSDSFPTSGNVPTTPEIILFRTDPDSYGIFCEYSHGCPTLTPDDMSGSV